MYNRDKLKERALKGVRKEGKTMTAREVRAKKRARVKVVRTVAIVIAMIAMYVFASYVDTHYTTTATVSYADNTGRVVAVDEHNGNMWEFKADNVYAGQTVKLKMYTNNTTTIYDDEVVGVKIIAEVE